MIQSEIMKFSFTMAGGESRIASPANRVAEAVRVILSIRFKELIVFLFLSSKLANIVMT